MTTFLNNDDQEEDSTRGARERFETPRAKPKHANQATAYTRRGKTPIVFNGMHRRRNKRVTW